MQKKNSPFYIVIDNNSLEKEYFRDLFRFRELFYFFAWRDILVRYRHTLLGILWVILRPLINVAVFALVFGKIAKLGSDQPNYPLFVLAGLLPWQLFASCIVEASHSLLNNAPMISKIYFPRAILVISQIIVNLVDYLIGMSMLLIAFMATGLLNHWTILMLPLFILQALVLCLGASLWIAAINVRFRDFRFIVPFIIQFGMFVSPVGYSSFLVPETWRALYFLNPMAGIIEACRWSLFGVYHADLPMAVLLSCLMTVVIAFSGFVYFRKMERVLADII